MMESKKPTKSRNDYAVAWVAALPSERASALAMLDEEHGRPHNFRQPSTDPNSYSWGAVGEHNVVIVSLASGVYGNVMAAVTVSEMLGSFSNIKFGLLVGIGGGIPRMDYDVRLGDLVISYPIGSSSGVIQYDLGKAKADGMWERKDSLNRPPELLLKAVSALQASHDLFPSRNTEIVREAASRHAHWGKTYADTDTLPDRFFKTTYRHPSDAKNCDHCDPEAEIKRTERESTEPVTHYGVIASGNSLVKDADTRERIASLDPNCICLEMEAAGLMNSLPCLVIRGICDYADTHKNDTWQKLAAARAAAYAKELLSHTAPVHNLESGLNPVRSRIISHARRPGRVKLTRGAGKTNEQMARLLPLLHKCPYAERKNRNQKRVSGTCEWFTDHNRFRNWYNQDAASLLWVSADPGCGKSVLARYLIDEVFPSSDRVVCYFFFKDDSDSQRSSSIAMCALLHQLLEQNRELLKHPAVKRLLASRDNFDDAFWDIWSTLMAIVSDPKLTGQIFFVLDALDECADNDRKDLIEAISEVDFASPNMTRFKLLLTSRPYDHIQRGFQVLESRMPVIHLSGEGPEEVARISEEIGFVIQHTVRNIAQEKHLTLEEQDFLLKYLTSVENRTYLWVHLTIDIIRKNSGFNKGDIHRTITELPSSVDEAYGRILSRCSDVEKARKIFACILVAEEALSIEDISVILAIGDDEDKPLEDIESSIEPIDRMHTTIRDLCGLFVVIKDSQVHLLHQTAREFLMTRDLDGKPGQQVGDFTYKRSDIGGAVWRHSLNPTTCHRFLASACLRFLQTDQRRKSVYGFQSYANWYWDSHMKEAALEKSDHLVSVGLELCDEKMRSIWLGDTKAGDKGILDEQDDSPPEIKKSKWRKKKKRIFDNGKLVDPRFSPTLILAAWTGVVSLVEAALDQCGDVNIRDDQGTTALWWAAHQDHDNVAKILLSRGAKTDGNTLYPDKKPLHMAAQSNCVDTLALLLDKGANVNARDARKAQPLHLAAGYGNDDAAKVLLSSGAQVDGRDEDGSTPLYCAATWSHLDAIRVLLDQGANINSIDKDGFTPLMGAVYDQDVSTVSTLLDAGASINVQSKDGTTALSYASMRNSLPIAELLIQRGANIDLGGGSGNALCQAVGEGHLEMVQFLLGHGADVNWANKHGSSVSFWLETDISSFQTLEMIKMLIGRGMKLDTVRRGRTVILECCLSGLTKTVKLLCRWQADLNDAIGFPGSRLNSAILGSHRGWTILHAAAFMADASLTRYLLDRGATVNILDIWKHTPLFWAVVGCVENITFSVGSEDKTWQLPFVYTSIGFNRPLMAMPRSTAAWKKAREEALKKLYPEGYESAQLETVKLLLDYGANPNIKGLSWRYALLPGLRKFRKQRKMLFALLKTYQDEPPSRLPAKFLRRNVGEDSDADPYDIPSLDGGSSSSSSEVLLLSHQPHRLEDVIEDANEENEEDEENEEKEESGRTEEQLRSAADYIERSKLVKRNDDDSKEPFGG